MVSQVLTLYTTPALYVVIDRMRLRARHLWTAVGCGFALLLAGCAVAPRYVPPDVPVPPAYKESGVTGAESLQPAAPQDGKPMVPWWQMFGDVELNGLEARLLQSNPSLAQAEANLRQARALVRQDRAAYYPVVSSSKSITRERPVQDGRA